MWRELTAYTYSPKPLSCIGRGRKMANGYIQGGVGRIGCLAEEVEKE